MLRPNTDRQNSLFKSCTLHFFFVNIDKKFTYLSENFKFKIQNFLYRNLVSFQLTHGKGTSS